MKGERECVLVDSGCMRSRYVRLERRKMSFQYAGEGL